MGPILHRGHRSQDENAVLEERHQAHVHDAGKVCIAALEVRIGRVLLGRLEFAPGVEECGQEFVDGAAHLECINIHCAHLD